MQVRDNVLFLERGAFILYGGALSTVFTTVVSADAMCTDERRRDAPVFRILRNGTYEDEDRVTSS
ncbi:hypothetical protein FRB95_002411 [Tulasnella sp. JGI-2019a]|nr:hypothetical protein FRB95_002411 [Tulasnella sp. JGI-2019a]